MDYRTLASTIAQQNGLDPDLFLRMINQESGFRPDVVSPAGAIGLGQLMPATARELGVDPYDPEQNLSGAARYLRQQMDTFGDPSLALAAYNAGAGAVRRYSGIPPYEETQNYVRSILGGSPVQVSTSGVNDMPTAPQQPQGLLGYLGIQQQDPTATDQTALPFYQRDRFKDTMGNVAMALNSLRLQPDQNLPQMLQGQQERRRQMGAENRTIEWLRSQPNGERFAQLAEAAGAGPALQMYQEAMKPRESFQTVTGQQLIDRGLTGANPNAIYKINTLTNEISQVGGNGTNVTVGAGETAWEKGIGEYGVDTYVGTQNAASSAIETLGNLQQMEVLMNDPNFRSGTGAEALSSAAKIVELLGGSPAEVSSMEAFRAQVSNAVLSKLGGSLGAGFSDGDRRFIETTVPNLTNSVEGNRMIISIARNMAQRQIEIGRLADQYVAENGRLDAGWNSFIRNWAQQNPIFVTNPDGSLSQDAMKYLGGGN